MPGVIFNRDIIRKVQRMLGRGQSREHQESLPTQATTPGADCLMGLFGDCGICRRQGKLSVWVSPSSQHGRSHPATLQAAVHVFLEQPADARWGPSSRVYALTLRWLPITQVPTPSLAAIAATPPAPALVMPRALKGQGPPWPFWEPHIRTFRNSCTGRN